MIIVFSIQDYCEGYELLIYGKVCDNINVKFNGRIIPVVKTDKHVGNIVGTAHNIEIIKIQSACYDMCCKLNLLLRQLGKCPS